MAYDRFLIAPLKSGLVTEVEAWQIPEDAYARLNNAYLHKGVLRKRFGSTLMGPSSDSTLADQLVSRLRINIDTTDGAGAASGTAPGATFGIGQLFSIGTEIFTVDSLGTPMTLNSTGSASTKTFDTTSGAYVFNGAAATTKVYYYPSEPVMGIYFYEQNNVENNASYAFDTQFVYKFTGGFWDRSGTITLQGGNANFVWATNWTGIALNQIAMFISNFNASIGTPGGSDDPLYSFDGTTWSEFRPVYKVVSNVVKGYVQSAKIIIPFKDRLLLLNTVERDVDGNTNEAHVNRCRFCHNGSPFPADVPNNVESAVSGAWLEENLEWTIGATTKKSDGAGWIDAPTEEEIMSAEFIRDRLIVYFERSTWELAYTGNQILPFVWQKLNTELGTKSLKAPVPFDKNVFTVGRTEVHACSGYSVYKINENIHDQVFEIRKTAYGHERVAGIRDFFIDNVYWSYPSINAHKYSQIFPDKLFMYNYMSKSWATADDCITAFGYYEQQTSITWESTDLTWSQAAFIWDSGTTQSAYRQIIGGNQHGFTFICDSGVTLNEAVMQVTSIADQGSGVTELTIMNHTLNDNDFIKLVDMTGNTFTGSGNYQVDVTGAHTVEITASFTGTYLGGGRAARVSRIDILSKQWNFYVDKGSNFFLAKIDFAVQKTSSGEITVDYYPSSTQLSMINSGVATGAILGDNNLQTSPYDIYPLEQAQKRLWHPIYFQTEGECVQIRMYLDNEQMLDQSIAESDFRLEGLIVYGRKTSERLQ